MEIGHGRPCDERAFLHKKIFGGISKLAGIASGLGIPGVSTAAGLVSGVTGRLAGRRAMPTVQIPTVTQIPAVPQTFAPRLPVASTIPGGNKIVSLVEFAPRGFRPGGGDSGPCQAPLIRGPQGLCIAPTSPLGASRLGGDAITGRFGAGVIPGSRIVDVATCPSGMALGKDGLCYDHLANRDRLYPRGRRPLLTGGEMKAISKAAGAARKLERAKKNLERIGLMKKGTSRRRLPPHQHTVKVS